MTALGDDKKESLTPKTSTSEISPQAVGQNNSKEFELAVYPRQRFVGEFIVLAHPPHAQKKNTQGMQAAFIHQGAGHNLIVDEMAGKEPVIGMDVRFTGDLTDAVTAARRIQVQAR